MQRINNTLCFISLLMVVALLHLSLATADYPGVIELVGYSNRRARNHYVPDISYETSRSAPYAKMQADIETVKQNIEKYNKLLTLDTKNLPDSQKDMLERIVERVARLKESLDINENYAREQTLMQQTATADFSTTEIPHQGAEAEAQTEPNLVLDETTLMQLQSTMDELATAQLMVTARPAVNMDMEQQTTDVEYTDAALNIARTEPSTSLGNTSTKSEEIPSTTFDYSADATDADDQMVAARSNNKMSAITAIDETDTTPQLSTQSASQRTLTTSGKIKTRATKRPSTAATKPSSNPSTNPAASGPNNNNINNNANNVPVKRIQRPSSAATNNPKPPTKQKLSTTQSQQQKVQQFPKQPQHQQLYFKPQQQQQIQPQSQKITQQQQQQQILIQNEQNKLTLQATADNKISSATPLTVTDQLNQRITNADSTSPIMSSIQGAPSLQPIAGYNSGMTIAPSNYNSNIATSSLNYNNNNNNNANDLVYDANVNASAIIDSLNHAREEYFQQKVSGVSNNNNNIKDKKPTATAKPTKYHYYPHNQHIYLLPECAIQQVCNAVYVRLNYTQPLCACPSRYRDPCSASLNEDDQHTTKLVGDGKKKAITLAKTCEATTEMRECRSPKDWSLLALQNTRTGKSHYLVICRCPEYFKMEGPMAHDQPTYASVPGIRVFGMMCVKPGYSVRRPPVQPPKRYQLQKPYYRPSSTNGLMQNSYVSGSSPFSQEKDAYGRPISSSSNSNSPNSGYQNTQDAYQQIQHQANYQYLNRPESGISSSNSNNYRPDAASINNFPSGSIYGRNNERQGEAPIEATSESENINTSTHSSEEVRTTLNDNISLPIAAKPHKDTIAAIEDGENSRTESQENQDNHSDREKRSLKDNFISVNDLDDDTPEFPWDRVLEFTKSIDWI